MKKIIPWIFGISLLVFAIDWAVMGMKIFSGDYRIAIEAYLGLVCIVLMGLCGIYKLFSRKCPHCGRLKRSDGPYCPYCGKKDSI